MTRTLFVIAIIFFCNQLLGHTHAVVVGQVGNVFYKASASGESKNKNRALAFLCQDHIKKYHPSIKGKVFLEFNYGNNYPLLSFDKFEGEAWSAAEKNRPVQGKGIRIILSSNSNRSETTLKLLEYAIQNIKQLKSENKEYYRTNEDERPIYLSLDSAIVSNIISKEVNSEILNSLNMKVYSDFEDYPYNEKRQYFLQNDRYHLIDFSNDSVYLVLDDVHQIISEYYLGSLVFDTDSTGYFYNRQTQKLSDKFLIENKLPSYFYKHTSSDSYTKRIYFEYKPYKDGQVKKFIYLTHRLVLISDFEKAENEIIINKTKANIK